MPKLSVCFITYNHANFVRQALDSVLMQQCGYDMEIVVSDDCSTDGTAEIVKEYAAKHADKIRLNVLEKNVGMTLNWVSSMNACTGEYIALLEGDDYWTDEKKLQKQINLLDKNSSLSFVAHEVNAIFEEGVPEKAPLMSFDESGIFTIHDFLSKKGFLQTGSIVLRRNKLPVFPDWTDSRVKCIDFLVYLMLASRGPFYFLTEKMSAYRSHQGGISQINWRSKKNAFEFDVVFVLKKFNRFTKRKFRDSIEDKMELLYLQLLRGNAPDSKAYQQALWGIVSLRPAKHRGLLKAYIINNMVPAKIYSWYKKVF